MTNLFRFSLLTLLISCSSLFTNTLFAQQNALRMTPFQPLLGKFSVNYERTVAPNVTILVEYQKWFEHRESSRGILFLSSSKTSSNRGYRLSFMARNYIKTTFDGAFLECGFYTGKHNIRTYSETTVLFPFFFPIYGSTVEEKEYKDVRVGGLRAGAGWQKSIGVLTFDFSGGLNLNALNNKDVRPTLGMKEISPYARLAVGVKF
jgi:hypothetical protein